MKKVFLSLMLFCGLALIGTSCKDNNNGNNGNVTPEVQTGALTVGSNTADIVTAKAVKYGQKNAIVLASKEMTAADNEGIAIIFNGNIVPGTYTMGNNTKDPVPTVVGFHEFNLGELPFIMGADTLFYGDTYYWINCLLSVTENNGVYTVILSQSMGTNANGQNINLALNFNGTLPSYTFDADNKFVIGANEYPIGLAATAGIGSITHLLDSINPNLSGRIQSLTFLSADHKNSFIINYLSTDDDLIGTHSLTNLLPTFPYLGFAVFPHVMATTSFDLFALQPSTAYILTDGTLTINKEADGQWLITIENARLTNLEHPTWALLNKTGSLQYHGYMFELSL